MNMALTPEELEALLEDAVLMGDRSAVAHLCAEEALLYESGDCTERHGGQAIADHAVSTWIGTDAYLAAPSRVLQARDIALVVTPEGVNVVRREVGGAWKLVILHKAGRQIGATNGYAVKTDIRGSRRG